MKTMFSSLALIFSCNLAFSANPAEMKVFLKMSRQFQNVSITQKTTPLFISLSPKYKTAERESSTCPALWVAAGAAGGSVLGVVTGSIHAASGHIKRDP